jgi:hypothetical protein
LPAVTLLSAVAFGQHDFSTASIQPEDPHAALFRTQHTFYINLDVRQSQPGMITLKGGLNPRELPLILQSG